MYVCRCQNFFYSFKFISKYNTEHPGVVLKINEFSDYVSEKKDVILYIYCI